MLNTYFFSPRPTSEDVINSKDVGLCYCSSAPTALDLAIQMGCKRVFLFGVDHADRNGVHHFWQLYDKKNRPAANANIYDSWRKQNKVFKINNKAYRALKKFADFKGVEIYNCSTITNLDIFDKITIDYVFRIIRD